MRRSGAYLATCLHHFASFCIPTRFPNFSEFSVAVPRIGTGSEVGLCVDAAEKLDKKAQNQSISLKDLFSNNKR